MKITLHNKTFEWHLRLLEWRYAQAALLGTALVDVYDTILALVFISIRIFCIVNSERMMMQKINNRVNCRYMTCQHQIGEQERDFKKGGNF